VQIAEDTCSEKNYRKAKATFTARSPATGTSAITVDFLFYNKDKMPTYAIANDETHRLYFNITKMPTNKPVNVVITRPDEKETEMTTSVIPSTTGASVAKSAVHDDAMNVGCEKGTLSAGSTTQIDALCYLEISGKVATLEANEWGMRVELPGGASGSETLDQHFSTFTMARISKKTKLLGQDHEENTITLSAGQEYSYRFTVRGPRSGEDGVKNTVSAVVYKDHSYLTRVVASKITTEVGEKYDEDTTNHITISCDKRVEPEDSTDSATIQCALTFGEDIKEAAQYDVYLTVEKESTADKATK